MIIENGKPVKCPVCKSTNVIAVLPFDYIKQCNDCGREFMSGEHN
jgi:ribosomal protein L37AE/L43A